MMTPNQTTAQTKSTSATARTRTIPATSTQEAYVTDISDEQDYHSDHNNMQNQREGVEEVLEGDADYDNDEDEECGEHHNVTGQANDMQQYQDNGERWRPDGPRRIICEWSQRVKKKAGKYLLLKPRPGPHKLRIYNAQLKIKDLPMFYGKGSSRKRALINAAEVAIKYLVDNELYTKPPSREERIALKRKECLVAAKVRGAKNNIGLGYLEHEFPEYWR